MIPAKSKIHSETYCRVHFGFFKDEWKPENEISADVGIVGTRPAEGGGMLECLVNMLNAFEMSWREKMQAKAAETQS